MDVPLWSWFATGALIAVLLVVDFYGNRGKTMSVRRALVVSAGWIAVSIAFGIVLGLTRGRSVAEQYFAGYLVEKALSIDNIFVFAVLFGALAVPLPQQRRVLQYGVVGALVLRAGFIAAGAALIDEFSWVLYLFGVLLVVAGVRMLRGETMIDPAHNPVVRLLRRFYPMTDGYVGDRFFVTRSGVRMATPLVVALVAIETTDIVFAVDSIPAIFGVTRDVFVVFTSNAFAVLGLRALYFVFADAVDRFRYLKYGLAALLVVIGVKLFLSHTVHIPVTASLAVIVLCIGSAIGASVLQDWRERRASRRDSG